MSDSACTNSPHCWCIIPYTHVLFFHFDCLCDLLWLFIISCTLFTPGHIPPPMHSGPVALCMQCVDALVPPSAAWPNAYCRWEARERRFYRYELWNGKKLCLQRSSDESELWGDARGWGGRGGGRRWCICGLFWQPTPHHLTYSTATVTWKDLFSLCLPPSYRTSSIFPLIIDEKTWNRFM